MTEIFTSTWSLISGLVASVFGIIILVGSWVCDLFLLLHTDYPRWEGLLVGILFAYFYHHREKNPWIRTLASPLKIIIDVLDIVWDETIEAATDLFSDLYAKVLTPVNWTKAKVVTGWAALNNQLTSLKKKLNSKSLKSSEAKVNEKE